MSKKYELTDECKSVSGVKLFRIRALKEIARFSVKIGDLGGWIEKEDNLSHRGDAWVSDSAWVCGDSKVFGDSKISGDAWISGGAWISGDSKISGDTRVFGGAWICGDAKISNNADYMVFKNSWSSGRYFTFTRSNKKWKVGCFYGTGEELIKKAYADSELSGRCYEAVVKAVEQIEAAKAELMQQGQNKQGGRND